ncbi:g-type lectin s-receptor-like serine/threonine-protein kinase rlk1 [Phtheirospermum japonicum]|uniref:G-type lectin s-receptor-like serine/threonine-protein kinase rlk1 n=1 Tax=Phtheirospermum japonicum TaxID=374723 RepID=A0A830B5Y3_9LAMI|nr:g-type lectin s-receptor-like serine/threonine-protein kinase rlk1 [Phtheirospermum japonicum]
MVIVPVSHKLIFVIMLTIMLPISATAQSKRNVTLGSVLLVAGQPNLTWESPSGDFAFGFRQVSPGGYLLAIMFLKTSQKTIAWSANGDNVAGIGSKVQLSDDGSKLVLSDSNGQHIWAASLNGSGVAYGAMLDNGNFMLARNDSTVLWQSFDEPTDTLLPGQVLNQGGTLFSSLSETNHSRGRFKLIMQTDGNLVLYPVNYPPTDSPTAYWASNTYNAGGFRVNFTQTGYIYVAYENGTTLHYLFSKAVSDIRFYQRLTLDRDGLLRHYVFPKSANSTDGAWSVHGLLPSDICLRIGGREGGGVCGYNSVCTLGFDHRPICNCPEGYSLVDPADKMSGCNPDFRRQGCGRNSTEGIELVELDSTEWPDSDYEHYNSVSEDWCHDSCLNDCKCDAAFFREGECWKNSSPLRHGRVDYGRGGKTLMKISGKE